MNIKKNQILLISLFIGAVFSFNVHGTEPVQGNQALESSAWNLRYQDPLKSRRKISKILGTKNISTKTLVNLSELYKDAEFYMRLPYSGIFLEKIIKHKKANGQVFVNATPALEFVVAPKKALELIEFMIDHKGFAKWSVLPWGEVVQVFVQRHKRFPVNETTRLLGKLIKHPRLLDGHWSKIIKAMVKMQDLWRPAKLIENIIDRADISKFVVVEVAEALREMNLPETESLFKKILKHPKILNPGPGYNPVVHIESEFRKMKTPNKKEILKLMGKHPMAEKVSCGKHLGKRPF